jgi:tetratricopeptide (TPR) repeat protein
MLNNKTNNKLRGRTNKTGLLSLSEMMKISTLFIAIVWSVGIISCSDNNEQINTEEAIVPEIKADSILIDLNERIKRSPNNADNYFERAKYFFEIKNDYDAAMADMGRVFLIDSTRVDYFLTLSDLYFTKGLATSVKSSLDKALELEPNHIEARMKLAELQLYLKNYKDVLKNLDMILKTDKYNAKAYFIKGIAFKELGDTLKAVSSFQTTVEQDPEYYNAYMELGILFSARKHKFALDYLTNALKIKPSSIEAWYAIGIFCQENGLFDRAQEAYNNILEIDPDYENAHYNLGYIHSEYLQDFETAIKHYTNAISANPNYVDAHYMRGFCYERLKNKEMALENYKMTLKISPDYTLASKGMGRILK